MNPYHFDTKVNFEMYRWKHALITDTDLLDELEDNIFSNKHKGHSLEGIIKIATGDKVEGLAILEAYNKDNHQLVELQNPSENLRRRRAREHARDIYNEVSLHRDDYFQSQFDIDSEHRGKIEHIQVDQSGSRFVTTCREQVKIWQLKPEIELLVSIDLELEDDDFDDDDEEEHVPKAQKQIDEQRTIASLSSDGTKLIVYERITLELTYYTINLKAENEEEQYELAGLIDVIKDYQEAEENDGARMQLDPDDTIEDIKFASDGQTFRIYIDRKKHPYYVDYNLVEMTPEFQRFS